VAVEALECPTMLANGFGEHNIQGIGDKHVPLIHNVMATDLVVAVSDRATDALLVLFNTAVGRDYLVRRRGVPPETVEALGALGASSICNVLAAIKVARHQHLGPDDAILTVATDGAAMYGTEIERIAARDFPAGFDAVAAGETFGAYLQAAAEDHVLEATRADRDRIFNLGYFTWVEQQGVPLDEFEARRDQRFWTETREIVHRWDELIEDFNAEVAAQ
jgi:cysteine synthase A